MDMNILVVDDEKEIADLLELYLRNDGYNVFKFYRGKPALECAETEKIDLALLDIMLPDIDGLEICRRIRENHNFPIIMLTAKGEELDKVTGLTMGADDYITKPFTPLEVVARVKAQLRRFTQYNKGAAEENVLTIRGLLLNRDTHECTLNEEPVDLTPTEFAILWTLAENQGKVVTSEELFSTVWQEKYFENSNNTVMVHVRHLRQKLKDSAERPKYIKTIWGVGYKIEK
ncbi:VanR-ABDEGLN family response regulator transcription factor [Anaerovorax odorimutans]|uniref:Stage 0 sporulation protein A homolog n=1 Tax=Anaerovorax odorimutans TaxID=109327 RepID=A0ABT1RRW4_9FIRM|nr:VanR-ABDEGLN family response regulator transcription factor [Anaerovorax odorimutans]MCQ4637922.1 VanR-ABDEGLN family response regulator transcription factor [Anaerovorax odorimutans]